MVGNSTQSSLKVRKVMEMELKINGKPYTVPNNLPASTSLNEFIREHANLKGTKFMCLEGGCGACIVSVEFLHPSTKKNEVHAVNSCLIPIYSCHGWAITTVEGIGNKTMGYNKIQKRLAAANGTQCGYCSPGMVMNMYSLLEGNPQITMKEIENSFGGNICRCTGYRPILDAFKSFASDAPKELVTKIADIEDMVCFKSGEACKKETCSKGRNGCTPLVEYSPLHLVLQENTSWLRPTSIKEIFEIFDMIGSKSYRFVAGNSGHGVYRIEKEYDVCIDVNAVPELKSIDVHSSGITLGGNVTLTEAMSLFYELAKKKPSEFAYCQTLADHIDLIANVPVRNVGSIAGNLSMKHAHKEFSSDVFLILEMAGAKVVVADKSGMESTLALLEYLATDMNQKIISKILLPVLNEQYVTRSFKIMPRAQNAHAYVNAGFLAKVDKKDGFLTLEKPTILFGGIEPEFLHATKTEAYLSGKRLLDDATVKEALNILASELKPDHVLPDATPAYRRGLAQSLLFKFILGLDTSRVSPKNKTGGPLLERPISSGVQDFETNKKNWPLSKPIPKLEAVIQCAGEAEYTNDMPHMPGQVWGQLVLCDRARATISKIDPSEALKLPGVVAFFSAKDIPGRNTFSEPLYANSDEPVFASTFTDYAGQAVGVILADTHAKAIQAAKKVKITYSKSEKVMIDMREIIANNVKDRIKEMARIEPKDKPGDAQYKVKGKLELKSQYHYSMETQTCLAVPSDHDALDVYPASQWPSYAQEAISIALSIPQHKINYRVKRLGGGYGCKLSRSNHVAVVSSLAAHLLQRPVRVVLNLETNMEWAGKRFPVYADYEAGVNEDGAIQYLNALLYENAGHSYNDSSMNLTVTFMKNMYDTSRWNVVGNSVKTDVESNTWCRAPGSTEGIAIIENIMEHIANVVNKDPIQVRLANLAENETVITAMINDLKKTSDYDRRSLEIEEFNKENRWKKRGISLIPMNYPFDFSGGFYGMVSIYGMDGTVAVCHGGIEMGQGINTKAAQVAAHILGVDLEFIAVKPTNNMISPNNSPTGGSIGSEAVCYAVKMCCEELNSRLEPIKKQLGPKATWLEIINEANHRNTNLNYSYMFTNRDDIKDYIIHGVCVTEVEVDILTGQCITRRVDLLEDAGESMSPEVDVGQMEGAIVMALGYFTTEDVIHDPKTGKLLTNRTWTYKPPGVKDIPVDMRITFRKNAPNPTGVLRSKATGEPPFCVTCAVVFAVRNALESARKDAGSKEEWFDMELPITPERIWIGGLTKKEEMKL